MSLFQIENEISRLYHIETLDYVVMSNFKSGKLI